MNEIYINIKVNYEIDITLGFNTAAAASSGRILKSLCTMSSMLDIRPLNSASLAD